MRTKKLIYVANARLPTEKANGVQIVRMCEAFAGQGVDVLLLHPWRFEPNSELSHTNLVDYYDVRHRFRVKTLPNIDVVPLVRFLRGPVFTRLFFTHGLLWGLVASLFARMQRGDLYYTRDPSTGWWLTQWGLPTVFEAHMVPRRAGLRLTRQLALRRSLKLFVTISKGIRDDLVALDVSQDRMAVLHDGVDPGRSLSDTTKGEARSILGLPQDGPLVVYAGQLFPEKGVDTLVKAASFLKGFRVLVVGGLPQDIGRVDRIVRSVGANDVTLVGHVPPGRVPLFLRAADILVLPNSAQYEHSAHHTSPLKLFEYMAAGRPIVASDVPSLREVLSHGRTAWLVSPDDPSALACGINVLKEKAHLAEKLARQSRIDVQQYSWSQRAGCILRAVGEAPQHDAA